MARKRVRLELVENQSNRRSTFKKRKASFFKKLSELSTLCNVKACAVVYNGSGESKADTWPSPEGAKELISKFFNMPEADQTKKMLDGDGFLQKQAAVLQRHLKKVEGENANLQAGILLHDVLSGRCNLTDMASLETVGEMSLMVENRFKAVCKRIEELVSAPPVVQVPDQQVADVAEVVRPKEGVLESVPVSMIRARADVAPVSEEYEIEECDRKYWHCGSNTSADVATLKEENNDIGSFLNFLDGVLFNESDGLWFD